MSDNGAWLGRGGENGDLRGGKITTYDGGLRVASIVCCPKMVQSGLIYNDPCHVVDVVPTLCRIAGANQPSTGDGINLLPLLRKATFPTPRTIVHHLICNEKDFYGCLQDNCWKYIKYENSEEVYNIALDPFEKTNLANQSPDLTKFLREKLKGYSSVSKNNPETIYFEPTGYPPNYSFPSYWGSCQNNENILIALMHNKRNVDDFSLINLYGLKEYLANS